jgi:hypothetical protein
MWLITLTQSQDPDQDMEDSNSPCSNKRGQIALYQHSQPKKTRNTFQYVHDQYAHQELWLGYQTMELIEQDKEALPQLTSVPIRELLKLEFHENEAAELYTAKISFPRVQQQRWPSKRTDGRTSHHFHLIQVPSDIDVNPATGFALVYHILLNFEKPTVTYTSHEITVMTQTKLEKMNIELGELREPIAPLCNAKNDTWNGLMRTHLKRPEIDGNALLDGTRIFALELDEETTVAKISRGFDNIASNDDLTLKVTSKSLYNSLSQAA